MREVNRSEPLASPKKQGVPREGFATGVALPKQDPWTASTASPPSKTTQLLLPCILHSTLHFSQRVVNYP